MKKLTLILLSIVMIVALAACGDKKCDHAYDNACDVTCNECGEERTITHDWNDATCLTPKTCKVCGATDGAALGHTPNADDGDCTTEVKCTVCGDVTTPAGQHTPNDDDGSCLTAITCQNCSEVLTAARSEHEAKADDGDCTTAVTCKHCTTVLTEAKSAHEAGEDDGDCTTDIICKHCEQVTVAGNASHTPNADDGNCLTAITCSVCGTVTTPARDSHTGGTATCTEKAVCTACGTAYGAIDVNNHIDENTDHICDRECGKTDIGTHADSAEDNDHVCDYGCGSTLEDHKGGEATCMHGKLCEICGVEYDATKAPDSHTSENYTYTDNSDGTHTKTHECGVVVGEPENHTIENHVCTSCGAMEIVVSFDADDYEWKTGDELYFCRVSRDNQWEEYCFTATVAEDGTVTWMPDKTLYWDGTGEHRLIVSYPANMGLGWDDFVIPGDQSTPELLREADHMNARWVGTPTTNVIEFELKHRMAKITVNYTIASQFDLDAPVIAEIYSNAMYCIFSDADGLPIITSVGRYDAWIIPYHNDNQFIAYVAPGEYNTDGMFKFYIGDAEVQIKIANPGAVTLKEGGEYTFDVKVGQDVLTIVEVSMGDIDSPFGDGWHNEIDLKAIGTQDVGKTAWEEGDRIIVTFTSPSFGTQFGILTYEAAVWSTDVIFSYLEGETPTVSAMYAPCYDVVDGNMQLKDGMQLGMTEYILAACSVTDGILNISFDGAIRNYSRLRIFALPGQTLTVTTTDFTPAGATKAATEAYTLTADENGNVYLYGTFAEGATINVKQGEVTLADYTFTADKNPNGTVHNKSYALDARPIIDGTLGGKTEATEEDVNAFVEQLKAYVDNGITTIIVTGSNPAIIEVDGIVMPAVSEAIYRLSKEESYNGKIDLILPDVTEIVDKEFYAAFALNSITLPKVTKIGDMAFQGCYYLKQLTFGSVLTEIVETGGGMFSMVGQEVGNCDLVLNCEQMNGTSIPDLTANTWTIRFTYEFKSITLTHTGENSECDECKAQ